MDCIDATCDLTEELLQENLSYWLRNLGNPSKEAADRHVVMVIPATHTFPYLKMWGDQKRELWREVLLEHRALLSDQKRSALGYYAPDEPRRDMACARQARLDHFVFSYLGVHDPYYTGSEGNAPFGLFLEKGLEIFPRCNATRRDLNSDEREWPPNKEFLLPEDARRLAACQVACDGRHNGDFWHYWGTVKYASDPEYLRNHWKWKVEFHYRDEVQMVGFSAVLWPYYLRQTGGGSSERVFLGDESLFRQENPECPVIPYEWRPGENVGSFMRASEAVVRYLLKRGHYPVDAVDALEVVRDDL